MSADSFVFSVFTKPWKMPTPELGDLISALGFTGVELPVRPGYQVEPENVEDLPEAAEQLAEHGVKITSIAGPTDERTIAACADAGVPIIRTCVSVGDEGYMATEAQTQREFDEKVPLLDRYGVTIGVQNHADRNVGSAAGTLRLIENYDPRHIAAVWDPAHCALCGEQPELAVDILWSHLCMVNLKNAIWNRVSGPEAEVAQWSRSWTTGRHGLASWPQVAEVLKQRGWEGVLCLSATYSDNESVNRLTADDIAFAKSLFA